MTKKKTKKQETRGRPLTGVSVAKVRTIRLPDDEWHTIQQAADRAGLTASMFIRETVLRKC